MARWDRTKKLYDRLYKRNLYHMIDAYGRNVSIFYRTSTACPSCAWDPINQEATNPSCSTCDGTGRSYTHTETFVKAVIDKRIGSLSYYKEGNTLYQVAPEGDARITMKLPDALVNPWVSTSASIFKGSQRVVVDGTYYKPKDEKRFGIDDLSIIEVTLVRIREKSDP
jgi:hypothetical protein